MLRTKALSETLKWKIDRENPEPVYIQISKIIEDMIKHGEFASGERLPGDVELGRALGINHLTTRKAINLLAEKKLVKRIRKSGTFVKKNISLQTRNIGFFYLKENILHATEVIQLLQKHMQMHNFDLKIYPFEKDFYERESLAEKYIKMNLDAAICVAMNTPNCLKQLKYLENRNMPHIRFGNSFFDSQLISPLIRSDVPGAMRLLLNHLWNLGHRKNRLCAGIQRQ